MTRGTKKIAYGIFYLVLLLTVAYWMFGGLITKTPTCFDGKQNQNETGIDCGGPCTKCEITELSPLTQIGTVRTFSVNEKIIALTEVLNSNQFYSSDRFSYSFIVYDVRNREIERVSGIDALFALERKYIFEPRITTRVQDIGNIEFAISDVSWKKAYEALRPDVVIASAIETKKSEQGIRVSGSVKNQSSVIASEVKIIAIVYDKYKIEVFPAQTIVSQLGGLEEKSFVVSFPQSQEITENTDVMFTKIFVSAR